MKTQKFFTTRYFRGRACQACMASLDFAFVHSTETAFLFTGSNDLET